MIYYEKYRRKKCDNFRAEKIRFQNEMKFKFSRTILYFFRYDTQTCQKNCKLLVIELMKPKKLPMLKSICSISKLITSKLKMKNFSLNLKISNRNSSKILFYKIGKIANFQAITRDMNFELEKGRSE